MARKRRHKKAKHSAKSTIAKTLKSLAKKVRKLA